MAADLSLAALAACAERELRMRARAYPRWVGDGRMTQAKADTEVAEMEAVLATLRALSPPAAQGSML